MYSEVSWVSEAWGIMRRETAKSGMVVAGLEMFLEMFRTIPTTCFGRCREKERRDNTSLERLLQVEAIESPLVIVEQVDEGVLGVQVVLQVVVVVTQFRQRPVPPET